MTPLNLELVLVYLYIWVCQETRSQVDLLARSREILDNRELERVEKEGAEDNQQPDVEMNHLQPGRFLHTHPTQLLTTLIDCSEPLTYSFPIIF
jgi:hypothetical protein